MRRFQNCMQSSCLDVKCQFLPKKIRWTDLLGRVLLLTIVRKDCACRHVLGSLMSGPFLIEACSSILINCFARLLMLRRSRLRHASVCVMLSPLLRHASSSPSLHHAFDIPSEVTPASPDAPDRDLRFLHLLPLLPSSLRSSALVFSPRPSAFVLRPSAYSLQPTASSCPRPPSFLHRSGQYVTDIDSD